MAKQHTRFIALFGAAAVAAGALTFGVPAVKAESPLQFLIKQHRREAAPPPPAPSSAPVPVAARETFYGSFFRSEERSRAPSHPRVVAAAPAPAPTALQRVICKRQCDGAQLVMGIMPRDEVRAAEAMCVAAGEGAPTELVAEKFVPGAGFAPPVQTASLAPVVEGRSALGAGAAPAVAAAPSGNCPSTVEEQSFMTVPIKNDATLRHGDIVATRDGFKVFVGNGRPPFNDSDFVDADQRKRVAQDLRSMQVADR